MAADKLGDAFVELQIKDAKFDQQLRQKASRVAQDASLIASRYNVAFGRQQVAQVDALTASLKRQQQIAGAMARSRASGIMSGAKTRSAGAQMGIRDAMFGQRMGQARTKFMSDVAIMNQKGQVRLTLKDQEFRRQLKHAKQMAAQQGGGGGGIGMGSIVGGNLIAQGISSALGSMGSLVSQGFAYNASVEQSTTSLSVMLGSIGNAKKLMGELQKFAADTPFELPTLNQAAVSLLATKKIGQSEILPMLKQLGDAAAGSSEGFASMPRITRAISQMFTKGKIQAEEMMQLSEAGVPAWSALAGQMGKSTAEVQALGQAGKLGIKEINQLVAGLGKTYEGLADKQSKTFSGLGSTIRDNIGKALGEASKPLYDLATKGMGQLVKAMDSPRFQSFVDTLVGGFQKAIALGTMLVNSPLAQGVVKFAALTGAAILFIGSLVGGVVLAKAALAALWTAAPIVAFAAAIAGVVVLIQRAFAGPEGEGFRQTIAEIYRTVLSIGSSVRDQLGPAFSGIGEKLGGLFGSGGSIQGGFNGFLKSLLGGFKQLTDLVEIFTADFGKTWDFLKAEVAAFWAYGSVSAAAAIMEWSDQLVNIFTVTLPAVVPSFFAGLLDAGEQMVGKWEALFGAMIESVAKMFETLLSSQISGIGKMMAAADLAASGNLKGAAKLAAEGALDFTSAPDMAKAGIGGGKASKLFSDLAGPLTKDARKAFADTFKNAMEGTTADRGKLSPETRRKIFERDQLKAKQDEERKKRMDEMIGARDKRTMDQSRDRLFSGGFAKDLLLPFQNAGEAAFGGLAGAGKGLGNVPAFDKAAKQIGGLLDLFTTPAPDQKDQEGKKAQKSQFVGLADFSKRIQESLGKSSDEAQKKKQVVLAEKRTEELAKIREESTKIVKPIQEMAGSVKKFLGMGE